MLKRIISGGQTGVDQAALDAAIDCNIPHGGWCPKGRLAENGLISERFKLRETDSSDYSVRTRLNIQDSDATLIFVPSPPLPAVDGTALTIQETIATHKPHLIVNLSEKIGPDLIANWINQHKIAILNIAGPRESNAPGIYIKVLVMLKLIFKEPHAIH